MDTSLLLKLNGIPRLTWQNLVLQQAVAPTLNFSPAMQCTRCSNAINFPSPCEARSYCKIPLTLHKLKIMDCEIWAPFSTVLRLWQAQCTEVITETSLICGRMVLSKVLRLTQRTGQIPFFFFLPWQGNSAPPQYLRHSCFLLYSSCCCT